MTELAILVPVLGRPHQIAPLLKNIDEVTVSEHRTIFVCSPSDDAAIEACLATDAETIVAPFAPGRGDFARKINLAYRSCSEPWLFQAATDLRFHRSWDIKALRFAEATRVGVIGTNDLGNPAVVRGRTATHILFSRVYIETWGGTIDGSGAVFSELYSHQFIDTEFVELASWRGQFRSCRASVVEHLHPNWKKADDDETYKKGRRDFEEDGQLYRERMRDIKRTVGRPSLRARR